MFTAKDARYKSRTSDEAKELWKIFEAINTACLANQREIVWESFGSYLVWDTLKLDLGYSVSLIQDGKLKISW